MGVQLLALEQQEALTVWSLNFPGYSSFPPLSTCSLELPINQGSEQFWGYSQPPAWLCLTPLLQAVHKRPPEISDSWFPDLPTEPAVPLSRVNVRGQVYVHAKVPVTLGHCKGRHHGDSCSVSLLGRDSFWQALQSPGCPRGKAGHNFYYRAATLSMTSMKDFCQLRAGGRRGVLRDSWQVMDVSAVVNTPSSSSPDGVKGIRCSLGQRRPHFYM
ncbi:unnamed protein product [Pleuronectes platessa]|uniref:Uncharacterized protein n=1 Tax=Pleuronectes platessa TaxID=8262 RepID=A0A9N7U7E8_PLEPL|nr:unnamed protein product [Pleuronectes platessa]